MRIIYKSDIVEIDKHGKKVKIGKITERSIKGHLRYVVELTRLGKISKPFNNRFDAETYIVKNTPKVL